MKKHTKYFCIAPALVLALSVLLTGTVLAAEHKTSVAIPDNGYATGASYGTGWKCKFGFTLERGACVEVVVPENGYIEERGDKWDCERGYRKERGECQMIEVPANGYLTNSSRAEWECERGYRATRVLCEPIKVPANAYLTNSSIGDPWKCERGYQQTNKDCQEILVPENAYLVDLNYGPGWECARGYNLTNAQACKKIQVPANAHLGRKGDEWLCNLPYVKIANNCVVR
jgi:hypothetical protein